MFLRNVTQFTVSSVVCPWINVSPAIVLKVNVVKPAMMNISSFRVPKQRTLSSWSRIPGQLCRLPNSLCLALPTAKKGCFVIRFSHDGRSIACACQGKEGFPILVYEVSRGFLMDVWRKTNLHCFGTEHEAFQSPQPHP